MDNEQRRLLEPKQVIVVRKDLNMDNGKFGAQTGHAMLGAFLKCGLVTDKMIHIDLEDGTAVDGWIKKRFTKVILAVKSEEKLLKVYELAKERGLPAVLITDAGFTVFDGVPTNTCVGIGPVFPEQLIGITDKLRLY